jgi:hypothetical protein
MSTFRLALVGSAAVGAWLAIACLATAAPASSQGGPARRAGVCSRTAHRALHRCLSPSKVEAAAPAADPDAVPAPVSLEPDDVEAWADHYLTAPGWVASDYDREGVHLVTGDGAALTQAGVLRVYGREELFRPAERAGALARSDRQEFEVDCQAKRFRLVSMRVFSRNNLMGEARDIPGPLTSWVDAPAGSRRASQILRLCEVGLNATAGDLLSRPVFRTTGVRAPAP